MYFYRKGEFMEEKLKKLSDSIVSYSLNVQENERVLITCHSDKPKPLILCLIDKIVEKKGIPLNWTPKVGQFINSF